MSKALNLLNYYKEHKLDEYDAQQNYHVVKFSDRTSSDIPYIYSGSYEECVDYLMKAGNPDFVVIDDAARMRSANPNIGPGASSTQVDQPQTYEIPSNIGAGYV